jgi:hypothetical protein
MLFLTFPQCNPKNVCRKPAKALRLSAVKQVFRRRVSERFDHDFSLSDFNGFTATT